MNKEKLIKIFMKVKSMKISTFLFVCGVLSFSTIVYAQKSQKTSLDKNKKNSQPAAPKIAKKTEAKPAPVIIKPVAAKKVELPPPKKVIIKPKKRVKTVPSKAKPNRFIKVLFSTPENGLEIEIDKKGFYVNKDAQIEVPLTAGKHYIYVRRNGQAITDLLELTVSADQDDIDLAPYIKDFADEKTETVAPDEVIQKTSALPELKTNVAKEQVEAKVLPENQIINNSIGLNMVSQNIDNIFIRFNDKKKTDGVTLNDWNYVFQQTSQNQVLPRYTKEKINLVNKFAEGQINLLNSNYLQAINSFEGAVSISLILKDKLGKETPIPYYGLGLAYLANKDYDRAIASFVKCIRIDSSFAMAYSRLGDAYKASGRGKQALSYYLSADKNGYKTFESSLNLADSLKLYESYTEAVNLYLVLVKEKPLPEIFISLGDCYVQLKQNVSALDSYRRAVEIDPKSAVGFLRLGNTFDELKEFQRAIESWQKSLELDKEGKLIDRKKVEEFIRKAKKRK